MLEFSPVHAEEELTYIELIRPGRHGKWPQSRSLGLRTRNGPLLGMATYRIYPDYLLIQRFLCRHHKLEVGLKLIQGLRIRSAVSATGGIWLESRADHAEGFYRSCGFEKKVFYREDAGDPSSRVVTLWALSRLRLLRA